MVLGVVFYFMMASTMVGIANSSSANTMNVMTPMAHNGVTQSRLCRFGMFLLLGR
jgi:hypothetical protein